ncbi:helix-turn-helix transcriptional regulator [Pararhizobium sp.]|uniref:helix-turn-helix transcriptional regulator n=1 Tax=Pararhizobium sp. TaxID=1977563 RepID=UPI0027290B7F|nr:helix-turn-helix domain-containing protein [Pararhizobium sp.]MDO9416202.1 excisionase family DNA-binding protein [Pararhizobium sp.]
MNAHDPLLTVKESAEALTVSIPTFYRLLKRGSIPQPVHIGRHPRWPQSEILGVIEAAKLQRAA